MSFKVDISGSGKRLAYSWALAAATWADEVEPLALDAIKAEAPVGQGQNAGRLRESIRADREVTDATATITFTANVPYAGYVVDGTAPHVIEPRSAQALHWVGPSGGVFAKLVHHPGTRPDGFAARALTPLMSIIQARLETAVQEQLDASE